MPEAYDFWNGVQLLVIVIAMIVSLITTTLIIHNAENRNLRMKVYYAITYDCYTFTSALIAADTPKRAAQILNGRMILNNWAVRFKPEDMVQFDISNENLRILIDMDGEVKWSNLTISGL